MLDGEGDDFMIDVGTRFDAWGKVLEVREARYRSVSFFVNPPTDRVSGWEEGCNWMDVTWWLVANHLATGAWKLEVPND